MEGYTYGADGGHCEADFARLHAETASEVERGVLLGWFPGGGAEEDGPEVGEGCDVACDDEVCEHGADDIPCPDAAEGESSFWFGGNRGDLAGVLADGGEDKW